MDAKDTMIYDHNVGLAKKNWQLQACRLFCSVPIIDQYARARISSSQTKFLH
jgi:hypothetical protein